MEEEPAVVGAAEENRVATRSVLAEIPSGIEDNNIVVSFQQGIDANAAVSRNSGTAPSPDELIIQQRGRRKIPVVFSPDIDIIKQDKDESQTESDNPNRSSIVLRSTPRKRLLYDSPLLSSTEMGASSAKKLCTGAKIVLPPDVCVFSACKALTSEQLIGIMGQIIDDHPEIEQEIRTYFPKADLQPIDDRINYLRRNIYKAIPSSRLISKTDSTAYYRVSAHLLDFKKFVIDQGRKLLESNQWTVVMDYVFMAWRHVRNTPIWDYPSHNAARRQCFKSLSEICMYALERMKTTLNGEQCENYKKQIKFLIDDNEDLKSCLQFLNAEVAVIDCTATRT